MALLGSTACDPYKSLWHYVILKGPKQKSLGIIVILEVWIRSYGWLSLLVYIISHTEPHKEMKSRRSRCLVLLEEDKNSMIVASRPVRFRMQELSCLTGMWPYLLYVFRMISKMARMMIIPMTMTAIIAPEPERHNERRKRHQHVESFFFSLLKFAFLHFTHSLCSSWCNLFCVSSRSSAWWLSNGITHRQRERGKYFLINTWVPLPYEPSGLDCMMHQVVINEVWLI